jgi:hypothetical protein
MEVSFLRRPHCSSQHPSLLPQKANRDAILNIAVIESGRAQYGSPRCPTDARSARGR